MSMEKELVVTILFDVLRLIASLNIKTLDKGETCTWGYIRPLSIAGLLADSLKSAKHRSVLTT